MTTPPVRLRAPQDGDQSAVLDVVTADDISELGRPDIDLDDVAEWWEQAHFDMSRDAVVLDSAAGPDLRGYGHVEDRNKVGEHHIDAWIRDAEDRPGWDALMDAVEARAVEMATEQETGKSNASAYSVVGRGVRAGWLTDRGYTPTRRFYRMRVELTAAPSVGLPDGVTIESLDGSDVQAREFRGVTTDAFVDHWQYVRVEYDTWLERAIAAPNHDWSTMWLARVDGEPAAALRMRVYDDLSWVDTVATLKQFRGRGLAGALLRTAFAESLRRGQPNIELGVDTENVTSAIGVYERAGMSVAFAHDEWSKLLLG